MLTYAKASCGRMLTYAKASGTFYINATASPDTCYEPPKVCRGGANKALKEPYKSLYIDPYESPNKLRASKGVPRGRRRRPPVCRGCGGGPQLSQGGAV